jgi:hypothetical protein
VKEVTAFCARAAHARTVDADAKALRAMLAVHY